MTAEGPIDTGPSLGDKISEVADDCTQPGKSCRSSFNSTLGVSLGAVREFYRSKAIPECMLSPSRRAVPRWTTLVVSPPQKGEEACASDGVGADE